MSNWGSAKEVLDYAIKEEEAASKFYRELAQKMDNPAMKEVFEGFAIEEDGHKEKLECIKADQCEMIGRQKVQDLKMSDYLVDVMPSPEMSYQDALILAMKKEKAAYKLYTDLAAACDEGELCSVFNLLAQEEAKHKLRFELEYDENVLTEN